MSSKVVIEDEHDEEMTSQPTKPTSSKQPTPSTATAAAATTTTAEPAKEESTETKPSDVDDAKAKAQTRAEADKEKALGNDFYKKKQFAEATQHYEKAIALDSTNIVYYNNLSAVYMETKEYEKAIEIASRGATIGREHFANYVDIAKAYARIGSAYEKLNKLDEAVEYYNKSLIEDYSDKTKTALKKIEEQRKKEAELAYIDPAKSEEAKLRGNDLFNAGKYVEAIAEYTEAIKRDPKNFKVYSNRAACYQKLMDWGRGLDDCEKCLAMDPTFIKAYIRKAKIQQFLKQYHKALSTCDAALKIEPTNAEVLEVKRSTMYAIQTSDADPERAKEAMKDPEIQAILRDPTIAKVLQDMQSNPQSGQAAMRDPDIRSKIEKLIAAGVLGTR